MANVATGSVLLTVKFDNITSSINSQLSKAFGSATTIASKAGSKAGSSFSNGMAVKAGAIAGLVSTGVSAAANVISSSLSGAISRVDTLNNFPKVMANLGYSSQDAAASIEKISESLKGLPSSTNEVASMVQQLAPMCDSLDEATNLGLALNNMMLASGAGTADCSRAMQQYSQMVAKGTVDLQSWRTLQEVMPGQLNQVSEALLGAGKSSTDLYEALQSGEITMDDFNDAVMQLNEEGINGYASFADQAKTATSGISTQMTNMKTAVVRGIADCIQSFNETGLITSALKGATDAIDFFADAIQPAVVFARELCDGALSKLSGAAERLAPVFQPVAEQFSELASGVLPVLSDVAQTMGERFDSLVVPALEKLAPVFQNLGTALQTASPWLSQFANLIGSSIMTALTIAINIFGIAVSVITFFLNTITNVVSFCQTFPEALSGGLTAGIAIVQTVFSAMSSAVSGAMSAISSIVSSVVSTIQNVISSGFEGAKSLAINSFNALKNGIKGAMDSAFSVVSSIVGKIKGVFPISIGNVFSNFRLPHLTVDGGSAPYGIGGKGSLPSFHVSWWKTGGIFDGASLIGIGEAGAEAVIPLTNRRYVRPFAHAIAEENGGGGTSVVYNVSINGATINDDAAMQEATKTYLETIARRAGMNRG